MTSASHDSQVAIRGASDGRARSRRLRPYGLRLRFHRDLRSQHIAGPQADHRRQPPQLPDAGGVETGEAGAADARSRLPRGASLCPIDWRSRLNSRMSSVAAHVRVRGHGGFRDLMSGMTAVSGQVMPRHSANLIRGISTADTRSWASRAIGEDNCAGQATKKPTRRLCTRRFAPNSPSIQCQLLCATPGANHGGLAPRRIGQSLCKRAKTVKISLLPPACAPPPRTVRCRQGTLSH